MVKSGRAREDRTAPEQTEASQPFDHQMPSTFSLAFFGPWRKQGQFQAVFFFFLKHIFTVLCVKALRQGREMLALDPGQGPPQMDAIRWRRTSLCVKRKPHSVTQALKPDPEQGDDEQPLQTGFHTTDRW